MLGTPHASTYTNEVRRETTHFRQKLFHHTMRSVVMPQDCRHACLKQAWCMSQTRRNKIDKVAPEADGNMSRLPSITAGLVARAVDPRQNQPVVIAAPTTEKIHHAHHLARDQDRHLTKRFFGTLAPVWTRFQMHSRRRVTAWPPRSMRGFPIMSTHRGGDRQPRGHALVRRPDYQVLTYCHYSK